VSLLEVDGLRTGYGALPVLQGISFRVEQGETAVMFGLNGAGKTTTVNAIAGLLPVWKGKIVFDGHNIAGWDPPKIVKAGIALSPEGRRVFPALSVLTNLKLGAWTTRRMRRQTDAAIQRVFGYFPRLEERKDQLAGTLSGGEQQMLAIGRALMTDPALLALDEPSLGLAPLIIDRIYEVIAKLRDEMKMTVLLVEQNAQRALDIADYGYILETGRVVLDGPAKKLAANEDVQEFYLGVSNSGRKSLRDVKHYKRRKRWLS